MIYLEGFDPLEDRHAPQIYNQMIINERLSQLKNFGYTFVIVDWHNSHDLLQNNAMRLVELLEHLKCTANYGEIPPQPFVIIGESMSGLISRYALTYMEQSSYTSTCSITDPGVPHHTRLLITLDAPHQGANIPIGLQYLYYYGAAGTLSAIGFSPWAIAQFQTELTVLDGPATRQMLKYHVKTDPFFTLPSSIALITEDPLKTLFDAELASLGNYPVFCKTVALSNGSWLGAHQPTAWDTTIPRQPNDYILDLNSETYIKVLGIKILGSKFDTKVQTNPAGSGSVFHSKMGVSHWKIKLKWFGAKLVWWTTYLVGVDKDVMGVQPYCVMPGSTPGVGNILTPHASFKPFNLLDFFGFQVQTGSGAINVNGYLGHPFFGQLNVTFNAYSDGGDFGFIPTYSSFDYDNASGFPLDQPILNEPIANLLSETPFDVVYTNPTDTNWGHLELQNPPLGVCQTCWDLVGNSTPGASLVQSRLLNREIGDDSLWLENFPTNYITPIECERDMMVNERNIYYNYDSQLPTDGNFSILSYNPNIVPALASVAISKEDPMGFNISQQLISNDSIWQNPSQPPLYGTYVWNQGSMQICCTDYFYRPANTTSISDKSLNNNTSIRIYPNPAKEELNIEYRMKTKDKVTISVYDIMGRKIAKWNPPFEDNSKLCIFKIGAKEINWSSGNYFIHLTNGKESYKSKLIITK